MSNYLVLEWGRAGIRGIDAEVSGSTVDVRASFTHDWPTEFDPATDSADVGRWLRTRVDELGGGERRLLVLMPRDDVAIRLITLPEASDATLPDLVRYQTGARSSVPLEQLAMDYLPLASSPSHDGRRVQSATVPARLLQHVQSCAKSAGLELCSVGLTTVALGQTILQAEQMRNRTVAHKTLVIRVVGQQIDVALWHGTDLLSSHVARVKDNSAVLTEVQRALISQQPAVGDDGIERVWLIAQRENTSDLQTALATRLDCEVHVFDAERDIPRNIRPHERLSDFAGFAAALGALQSTAQCIGPIIDFLNPRRRQERPDRTRLVAALAVGILLMMLTSTYLASRAYVKSLAHQITARTKQVQDTDDLLNAGEPTRELMAFLTSWEGDHVNWLEQILRISDELPEAEKVCLNRWRFDRGAGTVVATTEAIGVARQRTDVQQLEQRLAEVPGFRIRSNPIGTAGADPEYPILFQLNAELVPSPRRSSNHERE